MAIGIIYIKEAVEVWQGGGMARVWQACHKILSVALLSSTTGAWGGYGNKR